ncbi:MAG: integrase arm-type DNA-binding domain-containing protein, partial [Proteobacteria bacterium]|nr:integrase arm-type DNA-binding domain-containing protein [Pseudomonadota bacterium]
MKRKLTAIGVEKIKPPVAGRDEYFDALVPGLCLRVTSKGSKSWAAMYRVHGKLVRHTLGKFPGLDLADARAEARSAMRQAGRGDDPRAAKAAKAARKADTVKSAADEFIEKHAKRHTRRWAETQRIFDRDILPAITGADLRPWRERPIASVGQRDVIDLIERYGDRPYMGNRVLAASRKLFNWAAMRGIVDSVPVFKGLAAPERRRDRPLTDGEIKAIWSASHGYPFGTVVRLLLLSGQRRAEVAGMKWSELDDAENPAVWTIPADRAKNGVRHDVPLSPQAAALIAGAPRHKGEYIFSTRGGNVPVSGFSKAKAAIDKASGFLDAEGKPVEGRAGWRLHDLRHTAGTGLQALRI